MNWFNFRENKSRPTLSKLLNSNNKAVWKECNGRFQIQLVFADNDEYSVYIQSDTAVIYIPRDNYCSSSFTHELLHLYLVCKGVQIGTCINAQFYFDDFLNKVYHKLLIEHVTNCIEHVKMLPIYLELGCPRHLFTKDFDEIKCSEDRIVHIEEYINKVGYWHVGADQFIGSFFAMKACANESYYSVYEEYYERLKVIDSDLYLLLSSFWNDWIHFDIEKIDPVFNNDRLLCTSFVEEVKKWSLKKYQMLS